MSEHREQPGRGWVTCHTCGGTGSEETPITPTLAEIEAKVGKTEGWSSGCTKYSLNLHFTVKGENTPEVTFMGRNNDANRRRAWALLDMEVE